MKYGNERIILNVPFAEKDEAKNLGAWWDADIKKWFIPKGVDPKPFVQWMVDGSKKEVQQRLPL